MKRLLAVALATLAIPAALASAGGLGKTLAVGRADGNLAATSAGGSIGHPASLHVVVLAQPNQKVSGSYSVNCSRGTRTGSGQGTFHDKMTPVTILVPRPIQDPAKCRIDASARLLDEGAITLKLLGKTQ